MMVMQIQPVEPFDFAKGYASDPEFIDPSEAIVEWPGWQIQGDSSRPEKMKDGLVCKGAQLCVSKNRDWLHWIREAHGSRVAGHSRVKKILLNLYRYIYWPKMQQDVTWCIWGCVLCNTLKPANRKLWLYLLLPILSLESLSPWTSLEDCLLSKIGNGYVFIVVNHSAR